MQITSSMACVTCIAAWSLIKHQIWSLSAEPFLSYSIAAKLDTPNAHALPTRVTPQMSRVHLLPTFIEWTYHSVKTACKSDYSFVDISFLIVSPLPAGRPLVLRFVRYLRKNFTSGTALSS